MQKENNINYLRSTFLKGIIEESIFFFFFFFFF